MSLTVETTTNDQPEAVLAASFVGADSNAALLELYGALQVAANSGMAGVGPLRAALQAEVQRRSLNPTEALNAAQAALLAHLTA